MVRRPKSVGGSNVAFFDWKEYLFGMVPYITHFNGINIVVREPLDQRKFFSAKVEREDLQWKLCLDVFGNQWRSVLLLPN